MFKIKADPEFWFTAELTRAGSSTAETVEIRAKACTRSEIKAWADVEVDDIVQRVVLDWKGFDAPFSVEELRRVMDEHAGVGPQLYRQYLEALAGAKRKN